MERDLTELYFADGQCVGCGPANPHGLRARFTHAPEQERVDGRLVVPEHWSGLPHIAHGGVAFCALDCLTAWTIYALRPDTGGRMPVTVGASIRYHKPVRIGQTVLLEGTIQADPKGPKDPIVTRGVARDDAGEVLAEMEAQLALLPLPVFKKVTGITELPEHYKRLFPDG